MQKELFPLEATPLLSSVVRDRNVGTQEKGPPDPQWVVCPEEEVLPSVSHTLRGACPRAQGKILVRVLLYMGGCGEGVLCQVLPHQGAGWVGR